MTDTNPHSIRVDRTAISVVERFDETEDRTYWHSRTPAERLRHVETLRRINYGSRTTAKLERIIEVVPRT